MLSLLFSPNGRIPRSRFWLGLLTLLVLELAVGVWLELSVFNHNMFDPAAPPLAKPAQQILALVSAVFVWPGFALAVKRFHDRNKGWLWALPLLLLNVAAIAADFLGLLNEGGDPTFAIGLGVLLLAALVWVIVELGCLRGTPGPNDFGPDPLAGRAKAA